MKAKCCYCHQAVVRGGVYYATTHVVAHESCHEAELRRLQALRLERDRDPSKESAS